MTSDPRRPDDGGSVAGSQTLERGLLVLRTLMDSPHGLTVAQVAERTGLHRSIAYRLLVSLHRTGFADRDEGSLYRVGPVMVTGGIDPRTRLREVADPELHRLATEVDATASLVEVVGDAAVATVVAEPISDGPRFSYRLGNRDPLGRGAGGIAALASGEPSDRDTDRVRQARESGFVTTYSQLDPGAYGIAAPIRGIHGVKASVDVVTNRHELVSRAVPAVVAAARRVAEAFG